MEIFAGIFEAKVVDYGLKMSSTGTPQAVVRFRWNDAFEYNWYGSFKEGKAREITLKSLVVLGLTTDQLWKLADGTSSGLLDTDKTVSIKVEMEVGNDGKDYPKIRWINELGGAGFRDMMSSAEAAQSFKGMNISGELAAILPRKKKESVDDIPF